MGKLKTAGCDLRLLEGGDIYFEDAYIRQRSTGALQPSLVLSYLLFP
jgi:hypothetical protein